MKHFPGNQRWIFLFVLLCIPLTAAFSQQSGTDPSRSSWVSTGGPIGGLGYDIRMDPRNPDIMYVTDAWAGAFKSINGGADWFPINEGISARVGPSLDGIPVFSLTIDPNNPDTVWVGTQFSGGVFRSDNGGKSWSSMSNGIREKTLTIRGFTVQPGNSNVVYLAGEISSWEWNDTPSPGLSFDMTKGAVYKTTNRGATWKRVWYGDHLARYIWIHPQNHELLYVSTGIFDREAANSNPEMRKPGGVGILKSRNGGRTWDELGVKNGIREDELYLGSLSMHPTNPEILIAAATNDAYAWISERSIGAVYRTENGGENWSRVLDLPDASAVEICETNPNVVYAASLNQFCSSTDAGKTWKILNADGDPSQGYRAVPWGPSNIVAGFPIDIQTDPANSARIFVNNYGGGNFLSEDGGYTWESASRGYTGALMHKIVVAQDDKNLVYASARSGLFKSTDGGKNWQGISRGVARAMEALAIALDPKDSSHLIAVIADTGPIPKYTYDGGNSWAESNQNVWREGYGGPGELFGEMLFSPTNPSIVFGIQGLDECRAFGDCNDGKGVLMSKDGGVTWELAELPAEISVDLDFGPDGSVYVLFLSGDLHRSANNGRTWTRVARNITSLAKVFDPDPGFPGPITSTLAVSPHTAGKIYIGLYRGGMLVSDNNGRTWRTSSAGLNPETTVSDIVVDPRTRGRVYAATLDSGVYISNDGGATWKEMNRGLTNRATVSLALTIDGKILYAATSGGGVFSLSMP